MPALSGHIAKLMILSFEDDAFSKPYKIPMFVDVNPESYKINYTNAFDSKQTPNTSAKTSRYIFSHPDELNLELLFDGTGVINNPALPIPVIGDEVGTVVPKLELFRELAFSYNGDKHEPRYLRLLWGTLIFKGRLISLDITYKLFNPNGIPIRAIASCKFKGSIEDVLRMAMENKLSPDITHVRTVKTYDNISNLTNSIYEDPQYYIDVAKWNNLNGFRKLKTGTSMQFPPVK